jgi:hypothetical protein
LIKVFVERDVQLKKRFAKREEAQEEGEEAKETGKSSSTWP